MHDVLVSEYFQGAAMDTLCSRFNVHYEPGLWKDSGLLTEKLRYSRALIVRNQTVVNSALLSAAERLVVVGRAGVGLDNIDVKCAEQAGIVVTFTPDQNAISVAELAIGMMLSLARSIPDSSQDTKCGNWNRHRFVGTELYGKTLGIVGAGKIGFLTARRARAFGMQILAYDPFLSSDNVLMSELQAELTDLDDLLGRADVVSCHLPSTPGTLNLFNEKRFLKMKRGALFVNTSRGKVISEPDLLAALKSGILAGAALDVRKKEPPLVGELEQLPNVILTPHIGAFTADAQNRVSKAVCEDVTRVLDGLPAINAVGMARPSKSITA